MGLTRVTITGADDSVEVSELVDLSEQYPFVEWGILVSRQQMGHYRFPSLHWIDRLCDVAPKNNMNISTHVCGRWVREMFVGALHWEDLPRCASMGQRIQINTHAEEHVSTKKMFDSLSVMRHRELIFQWDGVNDHLAWAAKGAEMVYGFKKVSVLFDTSGGAGIFPLDGWSRPPQEFPCGYAGGIGPENVVEQVRNIQAVCHRPFWIDMERRVRSADDSMLDMERVRAVLKQAAPLIGV